MILSPINISVSTRATDLVEMRAIVLFVSLGEADQTADELAVIAEQFDQLLMMLAAATGNILIWSNLIV